MSKGIGDKIHFIVSLFILLMCFQPVYPFAAIGNQWDL